MDQSAQPARARMLERVGDLMGISADHAALIVSDVELAAAAAAASDYEAIELAVGGLEVFVTLYVRIGITEVCLAEAEAWVELDKADRDLGADWWVAAVLQRLGHPAR